MLWYWFICYLNEACIDFVKNSKIALEKQTSHSYVVSQVGSVLKLLVFPFLMVKKENHCYNDWV